jgi:hypothetical protein
MRIKKGRFNELKGRVRSIAGLGGKSGILRASLCACGYAVSTVG